MKKIIAVGFVWFFGLGGVSGQSPYKFRSSESLGISDGQLGGYFQLQTINGVARGPWFLGAGAGLDYYRFRTVPMFLSASRDLWFNKRDGMALFLNGGTNLPWERGGGSPITGRSSYSGGQYWSGGASYVCKLGEHTQRAVFFSAGYEIKKMREKYTSEITPPCYLGGNCSISQSVYYQFLNRILFLMIGYRF